MSEKHAIEREFSLENYSKVLGTLSTNISRYAIIPLAYPFYLHKEILLKMLSGNFKLIEVITEPYSVIEEPSIFNFFKRRISCTLWVKTTYEKV